MNCVLELFPIEELLFASQHSSNQAGRTRQGHKRGDYATARNRRQHVIGLRDYLEDHTNEERQYLEQSLVPEPTRSHRSSLLLVIICFEKRSKELKRPRMIRIVLVWQLYFLYHEML